MTIEDIINYISSAYLWSTFVQNEHGVFFYSKEGQTFPFATIVFQDNEYDNLSQLDRPWFFRLNIGISQDVSRELFGEINPNSEEWKTRDFSVENTLIPHPMYASLGRVSIINPSQLSFDNLKIYLNRSYNAALTQDSWIRK